MPPSEQALNDLRPGDDGAIGTCIVGSLDVRDYIRKSNPRMGLPRQQCITEIWNGLKT